MQEWLKEKIEQFQSLLQLAKTEPLLFTIVMAIGGGIIWIQWRFLGRSQRKAVESLSAGLRESPQVGSIPHETGIGTQKVLVMRPANKPLKIGFWCGLMFGAMTWFFFGRLQASPVFQPKETILFLFSLAMTVGCLLLIGRSFTRIYIGKTELVWSNPLRGKTRYPWSSLVSAGPVAKSVANGVKLTYADGRTLKIMATMSGYSTLLNILLKRAKPGTSSGLQQEKSRYA